MKVKVRWEDECIFRGKDEFSGASIWQLTSAPVISHDIYGEQIYASTDGTLIAFLRDLSPYGKPTELWVCDLPTKRITRVCEVIGGFASSPFLDSLYFVRIAGNERCLTRLNLKTLEQEDVFTFTNCPLPDYSSTVSPDECYFVSCFRVHDNLFGLYRVDMKLGRSFTNMKTFSTRTCNLSHRRGRRFWCSGIVEASWTMMATSFA